MEGTCMSSYNKMSQIAYKHNIPIPNNAKLPYSFMFVFELICLVKYFIGDTQ